MIAQRDWFERRKYGGWGIGRPRKWQGWIYLAIIFLPFIIFQSLPYWNQATRIIATVILASFLLIDILPLMVTLKKDEREHKIESISERNAAWTMVMVLIVGVLYEGIRSAINQSFQVNIFLIIALFGGLLAKAISNIYLERRPL